jgi:rod shape-determining protein MreD
MRQQASVAMIALLAAIAVLLAIVPLPFWLDVIRPAFPALVVLYFSTMAPYSGGISLAFFPGLALDVLEGSLLGQHALALSLLAYLAIRFHLMTRAKPLFEQSLLVLGALLIYEAVLWAIDGWTGHPLASTTRWVHTLIGAALWPVIVGLMGRVHTPQ